MNMTLKFKMSFNFEPKIHLKPEVLNTEEL